MKKLILILLLTLGLTSCKERELDRYIEYDFIISEKVILNGEYFVKSTDDGVLQCDAIQYIKWEVEDTLQMKYYLNGFKRNMHFLNK